MNIIFVLLVFLGIVGGLIYFFDLFISLVIAATRSNTESQKTRSAKRTDAQSGEAGDNLNKKGTKQ